MRNRLRLLPAFLLLLGVQLFAADEFTIDPVHSSATFAVKHMLVSTVRGRFSDVSGAISYDEKDPSKSSVVAIIKTASINTDNQKRDDHLRSADFFEAGKYPEIRFESTRVQKTGDGELQVTGNLTMKGVTRQVTLPVTLAKVQANGKTRLGVEIGTQLNRFDYNVSYDSTGTTVGKEIKVEINLEAVKNAPQTATR